MANRRPPNYYSVLEVSDTASASQIRDAYKRAALKTHPDRVPAGSPERAARTRKFQLINDAYYTLSDPTRRREYDALRRQSGTSGYSDQNGYYTNGNGAQQQQQQQQQQQNAYSAAWSFFTGNQPPPSQQQQQQGGGGGNGARTTADSDAQFGDVFEEMLREEGMAEPGTGRPTSKFWSVVGGLSGGALGFIVANVPGLLAGAVAGNRLGAVRDARGKSVYAVFQELPQDDRARLLSQMAAKVFSHAVGI